MDFKTLLEQITGLFAKLSKKQKIIIAASTVAVIGFIVFLVLYTGTQREKEGYRVLFDNISPADAALVVSQLEKDGIPYKLVNESTIKVPREYVYKERIAIAAQGLPKSSKVGFELFDKQQFGETDFAQKIKFMRALEGELARTVESLTPIEEAKVHIAMPKESVFVEKETVPTASVVVKVSPNMKLSSKQIIGIRNLVSASVAKLTPENVKIVDQDGEPLGMEAEEGFDADRINAQIRYKKAYEKAYEKKIENLLAPVLGGKEKVVAKVTIDFDFEKRETVSEYYDPESVVRSEQTVEEKREGAAPKETGGVPGAISNIGPVQGTEEGKSAGEKYEKSSSTTNYEISKKVTNTKGAFATIKRITASVVVDGKYKPKKDEKGNPTGEKVYTPLDPTEIDAITSIVKNSIGFDSKRGDDVSVRNFEFTPAGVKMPETTIEKTASMITPFLPILKYLFAGVLLFLFYKKIIAPFGERMLQEYQVEEEEEFIPESEEILEESDTMKEYKMMKQKVEEELGISEGVDEEDLKHEILLDKIRKEIESRPEEAAKLLKSMLDNEKE